MDPNLFELLHEGDPADEVSALIRLEQAGAYPDRVRVVADIGRFVTVRLARKDIPSVRRDPRVASMKAPDPLIREVDESETPLTDAQPLPRDVRRPIGIAPTGAETIVAAVDWGIDFACPSFRSEDGGTRFVSIWNQAGDGPAPAPYGYGSAYDGDAVARALAASNPYAALRYHPGDSDPGGTGSHGTHVLDIAAGNGRHGGPEGVAPGAMLAFVHLAGDATGGLANLGDSVNLVEAVHFLFEQAGERPCCVNLSIGNHGGPHDGSTLVEQALDELLSAAPGRAICQSTGNYRDRSTHASFRLAPGQHGDLTWRTDQADRTPNELEIWYPGADRISVRVTAPTGETSDVVALGGRATMSVGGRECCRVYHRAHDPQNADHLVNIFLDPDAPPGDWVVTVVGDDVTDGRVQAWIERDEGCPSCQSRFVAHASGHGTTGTICNGRRTIAVGAYDAHPEHRPLASFSSLGPTRDGRQKPDLTAPGVRVLAARSAPSPAHEPVSALVRKSGTSMAAPHATGTVALIFEAAGRRLPISETRKLLLATAEPPDARPGDRYGFGSGYLDVEAAVEAVSRIRLAGAADALLPATSGADTEWEDPRQRVTPLEEAPLAGEEQSIDRVGAATAMVAGLAPAEIFDAFVSGSPRAWSSSHRDRFDLVASPGARRSERPRAGDVVVVRALGEGSAGQISVVTEEPGGNGLSPQTAAAVAEAVGPATRRAAPRRRVRTLTDAAGRVPLDRLILRPRTFGDASEQTPSTFAAFRQTMKSRFGVDEVRIGTFARQAPIVNGPRFGQPAPTTPLTEASWKKWYPGESSPVYAWIVEAFEHFRRHAEWLPVVREIEFYETEYMNVAGKVVPDRDAVAKYGGGHMTIYKVATTEPKAFPIGRSVGSSSRLDGPDARKSMFRYVVHELAHGLAERLEAALPGVEQDYARTAGWFGMELYDVGSGPVRDALAAGRRPPATVEIRNAHPKATRPTMIAPQAWNHPQWEEQPLSRYMVEGGVREDFAEAILVYFENPALLKARVPQRYSFIHTRFASWRQHLGSPTSQGAGGRGTRPTGTTTTGARRAEATEQNVAKHTFKAKRGPRELTMVAGGLTFDAASRRHLTNQGFLLAGADQGHLAFHNDRLGYDQAYTTPEDPFRWNKLKELIDSGEKIQVLKKKIGDRIQLLAIQNAKPHEVTYAYRGLTLLTKTRQLEIYPNRSKGSVSPLSDTHQVFYTTDLGPPQQNSLAHELLGHMWLAVRKVPYLHPEAPADIAARGTLLPRHGIRDPFDNVFSGTVFDFIYRFIGSADTVGSPTFNVGPGFAWRAIDAFVKDFPAKVVGKLNGTPFIPRDVRARWEVVNNNHAAAPASAPKMLPNHVVPVTREEIERRLQAFYATLSEDKKYVFLRFLDETARVFGAKTFLADKLLSKLKPPAGMKGRTSVSVP
jgi:subtilisin family serine protease